MLTLVEIVLVFGIAGLLVGVSAAAATTAELRSQSRKLVHGCKTKDRKCHSECWIDGEGWRGKRGAMAGSSRFIN
jgi:hypothetical protein